MKQFPAHRFIPAVILSAAASIPIITAVRMMYNADQTAASGPGSIPQPGTSTPTPIPPPPGSTPQPVTPTPTPTKVPANAVSGTFQGGTYPDLYGYLSSSITITKGKITGVSISAPMGDSTSAYINQQVVPLLKQETLKAQSANINTIGGATSTSYAYYQSLLDALKLAGR